jgi:hypothetical protein
MEASLFDTLIAGLALLPWAAEILWQLRLQARFLASLPETSRSMLPPHPRQPWFAFLGSARFHLAFWRLFRRDLPDDPPILAALKRQMRASLWRELVFAAGGLAVLTVLLVAGWRPW